MKEKNITSNKAIALNLISSLIAYVVSFGISFFLSPFIVKNVGVDAYGFVGLANNFITYATLVTVAINTMVGRFVTIKIREGDFNKANKYFTSVFIADSFIAFILAIIGLFVWIYLEKIIQIPENIFWDVKILFAISFINGIVSMSGAVFSIATFATNKIYLNSIRAIESNVARAIILVLLFMFAAPKISYLGITALLTSVYCVVYNMYYMHKYLPQIKINKKHFDFQAIKELVSSGVWNLITRLGQMLTDGLDLLIANLFIDANSMGVLSLAKTIPSVITGIVASMVGSFSPNLTILYADGKIDELKNLLRQSMKIMGVICNLPIIVLIVCGEKFFMCWQPTQDAKQLQILSILTCAGLIVNGGINCVYNIFTVVNKLKFNSLVLLVSSLISILTTFILLKTTNLGVYAVAGVSTTIMIIKNITLIVPYSAKCLNLKWYVFYPDIVRPIAFVLISVVINELIVKNIVGSGWINLIICSVVTVATSSFIGLFIILRKADRKVLYSKLKKGGK